MIYDMIWLVIASNDILLNLSIVFIYYLIFDNSLFQYIKPNLPIVENWLSFITLLKYTNLFFYCSFDIYLSISHLLGYDLPQSDLIRDLGPLLKL